MRYYLSPSLMYGHDEADGTAALSKQQSRQAACRHHGRPLSRLALSASFVAQIRPYTSLPIDVHLMVEAPASFMSAVSGADAFSPYPETICREAFRVIQYASSGGERVWNGAQSRHTG